MKLKTILTLLLVAVAISAQAQIKNLGNPESFNMLLKENFSGKTVYIDVMASWCKPCLTELPASKKLDEYFNENNIVRLFVTIDSPEDIDNCIRLLNKYNLSGYLATYHQQEKRPQNKFAKEVETLFMRDEEGNFAIKIPRYAIADKQGNIIIKNAERPSKPDALKEQIQKVISAKAQTNSSFTLQGNIDGLQKGDTIILSEYKVPEWRLLKQDTLIVQENNSFRTIVPLEHTSYYTLMHFPKIGKPLPSSKRALTFLAGQGEKLSLTGTVEYFVLADIKGGFYNNPLVQHEYNLEREYNKAGIDIYRNIEKARANNQKDSAQFYAQQFNTRRLPEQLRIINDSVANNTHNSEYAAFQFLMRNHSWSYLEGKTRFDKFNDEVKETYFGKKVKESIQKKGMLEVGSTPPNFTVVTTSGVERTLSSYKGKHLLLYYWGMCPASIQISPQLTEFYKTYRTQGLEILSITKDDPLKSQPQLKKDPDIWAQFKDFLNPIWEVVYEVEHNNAEIGDNYLFNVLPTVMLISPEGKTLFRGYNDYAGLEKAFLNDLKKK